MNGQVDRNRDEFVRVCGLMVQGADDGRLVVPEEKLALARKVVEAGSLSPKKLDALDGLAAAISRHRQRTPEWETDPEYLAESAPHLATLRQIEDDVDDLADQFVALAHPAPSEA